MTKTLFRTFVLTSAATLALCITGQSFAQKSTPEKKASGKISATLVHPTNGKYYFFTKKRYFRLNGDTLEKVANIEGNWDKLLNDFDAVFINPNNKKAYFFKGSKYSNYNFKTQKVNSNVDNNKALRINRFWKGVPNNIDAAVRHPDGKKVYFFKGSKYYRYNLKNKKVDRTAPISGNWKGVPNDVDAALLHKNGSIYFFKGEQYYRYNISMSKVQYARTIGKKGWKELDFSKKNFTKEKTNYRKETDACGPDFLTDVIGDAISGSFINVCKKHDACYREKKKSQRACDNEMRAGFNRVCASKPLIERPACEIHAGTFVAFIESTYGGAAYGGEPQGKIVPPIKRKVTKYTLLDDEVEYCVTIKNNSKITQEYEVRLLNSDGKIVDREPDTHELNILSNGQDTICVGTNGLYASRSDLSKEVTIQLVADMPNYAITDDMVVVDSKVIRGR